MTIDLEAIKARLAAATPGPWRFVEASDHFWSVVDHNDMDVCDPNMTRALGPVNGEFIANAPEDIGILLEEVQRLREAIAQHRAHCLKTYRSQAWWNEALWEVLDA